MSAFDELLVILGMMIVTFGVRYPVLVLAGRINMRPRFIQALGFVPVAVLSAITLPMMLAPDKSLFISVDNDYLVAGVAAIVFVAFTRHLLLTIVLGMALFMALRFFV